VGKPITDEAGRALRRARKARGLTLRDVGALSRGSFTPTAVAAYERGERSISLQRFIELARLYEIQPERLLADILRASEGRAPVVLDLERLSEIGEGEGRIVEGFIDRVLRLRHEEPADAISLRAGDIEVLATATGRKPGDFLEVLRQALRPS
jgi:transcriptional regulator with XRE-family HTH domain